MDICRACWFADYFMDVCRRDWRPQDIAIAARQLVKWADPMPMRDGFAEAVRAIFWPNPDVPQWRGIFPTAPVNFRETGVINAERFGMAPRPRALVFRTSAICFARRHSPDWGRLRSEPGAPRAPLPGAGLVADGAVHRRAVTVHRQ